MKDTKNILYMGDNMENTVKSKKKPLAFYLCSSTFAFERSAYYGSKGILLLFIAASIATGGLGLTSDQAALAVSNLVAFTYLAPIFGGMICDRWLGARYAIPAGMVIMGAGYFIGANATDITGINIMIVLVALGTGLFKGNLSALTGTLFEDENQLDSAFSTQYSFINIGSFFGTTFFGFAYMYLFNKGNVLGYTACFKFSAAIMIIGAIIFILGWKLLREHGKRPFLANQEKTEGDKKDNNAPLTSKEKKRIMAIILVSTFSVIFWLFWYVTYLAVYDYGGTFVDMSIGNFEVPLLWFDSENAFLCIALGPVLGALWYKLSQRPQGDLSLFKKTGIGLAFLGVAFLMLVGAEFTRGIGAPETAKASIGWIIAFGFFLSVGEMCFSPLGNSFVSKYAPKKFLAVLMGVWTFATFIAGKTHGAIYNFTKQFDMITVYTAIPVILFVCAISLFVLDKNLSKLVADDNEDMKNKVA